MKTLKHIIIFALVLLIGCVKLEEDPKSKVFADGFFDSTTSLEEAVSGVYIKIINNNNPWEVAMSSTRFRAAFCGADDFTAKTGSNKQNWVDADIFAFRLTPLSGSMGQNAWDVPWDGITQANWVIEGSEDLLLDLEEQELTYALSLIAEARMWRAWCYFYLVRMFGPLPIIETYLYNPGEHLNMMSEQVESVYNFIERDIRFATVHGNPSLSNIKQSRITKEAADAFMAEYALTRAGWPLNQTNYYDSAQVYSEKVINSNIFQLFPSFDELFDPINEDNSEYIWQLNFCLSAVCSNGGNVFSQKGSKPDEFKGFCDFFVEKTFANNFPEGPRKIRSLVSTQKLVVENDTVELEFAVDHAFMSKFWGSSYDPSKLRDEHPSSSWSDLDLPMIRLAEVQFIYAEAQAMSDGAPSATSLDYVNQIRRRGAGLDAYSPDLTIDLPSGLSAVDFQNEILEERGWEFMGEMQRWFDLTRLEKVAEVTANRDPSELELINAAPVPGDGLSIGDEYYYMKPTKDAEQNPNLDQVNDEVLIFD